MTSLVAVFGLESCFQGRGKPLARLVNMRIYSDVGDEWLLVLCQPPGRTLGHAGGQEPPGTT